MNRHSTTPRRRSQLSSSTRDAGRRRRRAQTSSRAIVRVARTRFVASFRAGMTITRVDECGERHQTTFGSPLRRRSGGGRENVDTRLGIAMGSVARARRGVGGSVGDRTFVGRTFVVAVDGPIQGLVVERVVDVAAVDSLALVPRALWFEKKTCHSSVARSPPCANTRTVILDPRLVLARAVEQHVLDANR